MLADTRRRHQCRPSGRAVPAASGAADRSPRERARCPHRASVRDRVRVTGPRRTMTERSSAADAPCAPSRPRKAAAMRPLPHRSRVIARWWAPSACSPRGLMPLPIRPFPTGPIKSAIAPSQVARFIEETRIGFMFAPNHQGGAPAWLRAFMTSILGPSNIQASHRPTVGKNVLTPPPSPSPESKNRAPEGAPAIWSLTISP